MPDPKDELTPELIAEGLGAFDVLERLGNGTYGTTFRAVRGDDEYALKVIHLPDSPEYLWEREVTSLKAVDHPNVMGLRRAGDFEAAGKRYRFLECEFIDGGTVRDALVAGSFPGTADDLRAFLSGLLAGVSEIHDLGIIHRDIKPANVALRGGEWGRPVLLDFGLARVLGMSTHTVYPGLRGTVGYMSPEQLRGERARTRSDLFSVGVVVFEAGTGQHPFATKPGMSVQSLHDKIAEGPPTIPKAARARWSRDITDVTVRLLSHNGHERLDGARALADLEGHK